MHASLALYLHGNISIPKVMLGPICHAGSMCLLWLQHVNESLLSTADKLLQSLGPAEHIGMAAALPSGTLSHCQDVDCRATTHTDLQLRAQAMGIQTKVIHNASIMNAVGCCGLQLYRFGEVSHLSCLDTCILGVCYDRRFQGHDSFSTTP